MLDVKHHEIPFRTDPLILRFAVSPSHPQILAGATLRRNMILNGMHRGDSTNIRRLNGIHNTLPVASARLRIGWNTASWPQPNPLFHSFRIHPLYTTSCSLSSRSHPKCTPRGITVPHPPPSSSSTTKRVSSFRVLSGC